MHTIMADIVKVMIAGFVFGVTILKASLIASLSAISISRITSIDFLKGKGKYFVAHAAFVNRNIVAHHGVNHHKSHNEGENEVFDF